MSCPSENALVGFIHRALPAAERTEVERHLRECEACRAVVANVADQGGDLLAPPPTLTGADEPVVELRPGERVGRYVVLERLGAGGMGVVYAAQDPDLARKVALKMLRAQALGARDAADGRARLLREAQTMARLQHPNVVAVHDVGTHGGQVFVAMEYVEGETLNAWLSMPRPLSEVLDAFRQAGLGLASAHAAGLVHRDFKPGNVLVSNDGRVRVTDFGLARSADEAPDERVGDARPAWVDASSLTTPHAVTRAGVVVGTPGYIPPEQVDGARPDPRTDQFSFCVTLYEALYAQKPFAGSTLLELHGAASAEDLRPPPPNRRVPRHVHQAVVRGLKASPQERHASMEALLRALEPPRQRTLGVALAGVVGVLALVTGLVWWQLPRETPVPAPAPEPPVAAAVDEAPPAVEAPAPAPAPRPPPRAKKAAAPAAKGDGVLAIHVAPWGELSVDERRIESANYMDYVLPISAGKHQLVVSHPNLKRHVETVTVEAGKTLQRSIVLR